jgi:hypothetical protein
MTTLTYNRSQAERHSFLALQTIEETRQLHNATAVSASYRHRMTSAITCALLTLCALLLRDLSTPELMPLQTNLDVYMAKFKEAASMLEELAHGLPYARNVLEDCRQLMTNVSVMIDKWESLPADHRAKHGWVRSMGLDRLQLGNLFPYQSTNPVLRADIGEIWEGSSGSRQEGVLWLF